MGNYGATHRPEFKFNKALPSPWCKVEFLYNYLVHCLPASHHITSKIINDRDCCYFKQSLPISEMSLLSNKLKLINKLNNSYLITGIILYDSMPENI
jgi:hypothetical protein